MKTTLTPTPLRNHSCITSIGLALAMGGGLGQYAAAQDVSLNTANNFAILAGSTITNTGPTVVSGGNIGLSPGTSITGFLPGTITPPYTLHIADAAAVQAQNDLTAAFNAAAGLAPTTILTGADLGGMTLTPGVYHFASSAQLTGILTLNDQGNADSVFVFQIGSTLTTASGSSVVTINDPSAPGINVFWQIGSSATLGTGTEFEGNIMADSSITVNTGSTMGGRLLAETGAVTLDDDTISVPQQENTGNGGGGSAVPETGSTLMMLGAGLAALFALNRRCFAPV